MCQALFYMLGRPDGAYILVGRAHRTNKKHIK